MADERIWFVSSSEYIVERCREVIREQGYDYPVSRVAFEELTEFVRYASDRGARVFVSRGKSAALLKKLNVPVVSLRFTYYDFFNSIREAQKISDKVAVVGYTDSWVQPIEPYYETLARPRVLYLDNTTEEHLNEAVRDLKDQGVEVLVCGYTAGQVAEQAGLKWVQISLEDSSIADSIEEAQYLLKIEIQRNLHITTLSAIFNNTTSCVISTSQNGIITNANDSSQEIVGRDCIGRNMEEYFSDPEFLERLRSKDDLKHELTEINHVPCTVNVSHFTDFEGFDHTVYSFQAVEQVQSLDQNIRKKQASHGNYAKTRFSDITGNSPAILSTIELAKKYALTNGTVLINGETGTGKEMFAQSIHNYSERRNGPFVAINCASLPQNILESELFGYVKGAFTGASAGGRAGFFEMAHGGTIFLDEIAEISSETQAKLLRVLQEKEVRRIGSNDVFKIDVRIIAATNKDLAGLVRDHCFREDLYYRLAVLELYLPPLRERGDDVILIAEDILRELSEQNNTGKKELSDEVKKLMTSMKWMGNVRQVQNMMERVSAVDDSRVVDLPLFKRAAHITEPAKEPQSVRDPARISERAKNRILYALEAANGNRDRAALSLGISKTTLWRRMRKIAEEDPEVFSKY